MRAGRLQPVGHTETGFRELHAQESLERHETPRGAAEDVARVP